jgi:hypothetical protein
MPIRVTQPAAADSVYNDPFVGPVQHTVAIPVPLSGLTTAEVDSKGWLKPGVPLTRAGALVGAAAAVYGVTVEAIKVAAGNDAPSLAAAGTVEVAVAQIGILNRAIGEKNLGRVYSANEIAGFALAGSLIKLIS